jgi:hypothetical protein
VLPGAKPAPCPAFIEPSLATLRSKVPTKKYLSFGTFATSRGINGRDVGEGPPAGFGLIFTNDEVALPAEE